jgi:hypothetical protein
MDTSKLLLRAYIDIETLPTLDAAVVAELDADIAAPRTHKKPETIAAWMAQEKPLILAEAIARTALDGTYGHVLAIGCALDDGEPQVWCGEEVATLTGFFDAVRAAERIEFAGAGEYHAEIRWIGHNVRTFDLRFLWQRAVILGITMPRSLREAALSRSWEKLIEDTMFMWNPERDRRISLDKLCKALGVPSPKQDMDGSKVAEAWAKGEIGRIVAYSRGEIEAIRACHKRMVFAHG